jgi:hypothetical protein
MLRCEFITGSVPIDEPLSMTKTCRLWMGLKGTDLFTLVTQEILEMRGAAGRRCLSLTMIQDACFVPRMQKTLARLQGRNEPNARRVQLLRQVLGDPKLLSLHIQSGLRFGVAARHTPY